MAYPPLPLPIDRTNATPQQDVHPADHNAVNAAVNDIVAVLGPQPMNPRRVSLRCKAGSQGYPGTNGPVMWNAIEWDTEAGGNIGVGGGNISMHAGGWFFIDYSLTWSTANEGAHAAWVWHAQSNIRYGNTQIPNSLLQGRIAQGSCMVFTNPGDTLQLQVYNITSNPPAGIIAAELTLTRMPINGGWSNT